MTSVRRALEHAPCVSRCVPSRRARPSDITHQHGAFAEIVTSNPTMHTLLRYIAAIARSPQPVLITGETGLARSSWRGPCIGSPHHAGTLWR